MDGMSKSQVNPCGVCSLRVEANSVLCVQHGKLIHGRCALVNELTPKFSRNCTCRKCDGNIGEAVEEVEELYHVLVTVREFTYNGNRVSAGEGCEAALTVRTICGWVKFRECDELLYSRKFPLRLIGDVYMRHVRPEILYGSEAWCLK